MYSPLISSPSIDSINVTTTSEDWSSFSLVMIACRIAGLTRLACFVVSFEKALMTVLGFEANDFSYCAINVVAFLASDTAAFKIG